MMSVGKSRTPAQGQSKMHNFLSFLPYCIAIIFVLSTSLKGIEATTPPSTLKPSFESLSLSNLSKLPGKSKRIHRASFVPRLINDHPSSIGLLSAKELIQSIRGGAVDSAKDDDYDEEESESEVEESDDDGYDEESDSEEEKNAEVNEEDESESDDEYDDEEDEYDDEETPAMSVSHPNDSDTQQIIEYDEVLAPPAMQQLGVSIGVMLLSNRIDVFDPKAVRIARFAFLAYIVSMQIFLIYVRIRARQINDRTPITISNPLSSLIQSAAGGGDGGVSGLGGLGGLGRNSLVKSLADQVLATQTTIYEYDLQQAKKMNGSLLFPMVFLYFLHFRMKQVQPLIMQTATGILNMVYSPLFQVYVLGRNLERPFKNPGSGGLGSSLEGEVEVEAGGSGDLEGEEDGGEEEDGEEERPSIVEVEESEESGEEDEESSESEYDSDED